MGWIKIIKIKISESLKHKLINVLATIIVIVPYVYFIKYLMKSIYFIERPILMTSSLFLANYFYNDSKLGNTKIGRIRLSFMLIWAAFFIFGFIAWLEDFEIMVMNSSYIYYIIKSLSIIGMLWLALICQPDLNINIYKFKTSQILYLLAHLFWILALFFIISSMLYLENKSRVFSQTNLIVLITLTSIAVTYSCLQQYIYKKVKAYFYKIDIEKDYKTLNIKQSRK